MRHALPAPGVAMSTRFVITECCAAPVRLGWPDFACDAAEVVCCACGRTAGTPGAEDAPEVDQFVRTWRDIPVVGAGEIHPMLVEGARIETTSDGTRWLHVRRVL